MGVWLKKTPEHFRNKKAEGFFNQAMEFRCFRPFFYRLVNKNLAHWGFFNQATNDGPGEPLGATSSRNGSCIQTY